MAKRKLAERQGDLKAVVKCDDEIAALLARQVAAKNRPDRL